MADADGVVEAHVEHVKGSFSICQRPRSGFGRMASLVIVHARLGDRVADNGFS